MAEGVEQLSRLAWRLVWLTPLATAPGFRPETVAMQAVEPFIDSLAGAASVAALCERVLGLAREAA
jgi:uncharacterized protein with von Willebrand factor type A (vWA) domain